MQRESTRITGDLTWLGSRSEFLPDGVELTWYFRGGVGGVCALNHGSERSVSRPLHKCSPGAANFGRLFIRPEELEHLLVTVVAGAPANASAMELILTASTSLESFYVNDRLDFAIALQKVVANNTELKERELLKRVYLARSMARPMRERRVDDATAGLAAEIAVMTLYDAFAAWSEPQNVKRFETLAKTSLGQLLDSARHLGMEIGGKRSAVGIRLDVVGHHRPRCGVGR